MESTTKTNIYRFLKKSDGTPMKETVETELALPEYMPEIQRIVRAVAVPKIDSFRVVGERLTVDGSCDLRMIYTAEDGGLYSFSQSRNFNCYCENAAFVSGADIRVKPLVNFVNCRATNQKKAEMKAEIVVGTTLYEIEEEQVLSVHSDEIEEKNIPITALSLGCKKSKTFSMSDTVESNGTVLHLIGAQSAITVSETKKIGNKVLLKGDAVTEISFISDENKRQVEHLRHTMPLNQIVEFEGLEEYFTGDIALDILSDEVDVKTNADGEGRAFDIALTVNASALMWEQKEYSAVRDAYSPQKETQLTCSVFNYYTACDEIRDNFGFRETVDLSRTGLAEIQDASWEMGEPLTNVKDGKIIVSGTVKTVLLYRNGDGEVMTAEKMLDYRYESKQNTVAEELYSETAVSVRSFDCYMKSEKEAEIHVELNITGTILEKNSVTVVSNIEISENETAKRPSAYTVYFPENDEGLWEIAKRYRTTVSAVAKENGFEGDTTEKRKILFIPKA